MTKHKKKTEIEISDEILRKSLPKAAEVLISLLESKDTLVRAHAAAYILGDVLIGMPFIFQLERAFMVFGYGFQSGHKSGV